MFPAFPAHGQPISVHHQSHTLPKWRSMRETQQFDINIFDSQHQATFGSVWVRSLIFSQLSIIQYVELCVFSLLISLVMIKIIYTLCLIIIIKWEVWTITHCFGLGHETIVCAVYLSIFCCIPRCIKSKKATTKRGALSNIYVIFIYALFWLNIYIYIYIYKSHNDTLWVFLTGYATVNICNHVSHDWCYWSTGHKETQHNKLWLIFFRPGLYVIWSPQQRINTILSNKMTL